MELARTTMHRWVLGVLLGLTLSGVAVADGPPARQLTEAERQAVVFAAEYLNGGPEAWWPRLSAGSPLRSLGQEAALEALEVRAGPRQGARWRLQTGPASVTRGVAVWTVEFPSGMSDTLVLELREEGDRWTIDTVRMSAEPRGGVGTAALQEGPRAAPVAAQRDLQLPAMLAVLGLGLLLIGAWRRAAGLAAAGAVAAVAAVVLFVRLPGPPPPAEAPTRVDSKTAAGDPDSALAGLLELRRVLATSESGDLKGVEVPEKGPAARVAQLWRAELALEKLDLNAADAILQSLPSPARVPRAELVRARLAFLRMSEVDTALAYERAIEVGISHDALLFEAAQAFQLLGYSKRADGYYEQLAEMRSREAEVYYHLAAAAVAERDWSKARDHFGQAWRLEPLPRDEVLSRPFLAYLLEEVGDIRDLLQLGSVDDPRVGCNAATSAAVGLPEGAAARVVGGLLVLEVSEGVLEVPAGCALAGEGARVYTATSWRQRREDLALADLSVLARRSKADLSRPRKRRELEQAVTALGRRGRWADLLEITDAVASQVVHIPPEVVQLRAEALRRSGRRSEARDLLITLAASNAKNRRVDPTTLYQLADLLVSEGQYDRALKLMAKAHSELPFEVDRGRLLQVQIEKRLAKSSLVYESDHFEILYPYERPLYFVERLAEIMEAERKRLAKWIPVGSGGSTRVYLLDFGDFQTSYGRGVLGLFDGKIRVPFADVDVFDSFVVSILTHELAHAMIAEASGDRAPHWLHEGLAQHVEMPQTGVNPISGYVQTSSLLSFPMIEPMLEGFSVPSFVPVAYDEARWVLHFIEGRYGVRSIHRLLAAFRDGMTTEQAVEKVFGRSVEELDREIWDWGVNDAPDLWPSEIVYYEPEPEPEPELMDPEILEQVIEAAKEMLEEIEDNDGPP
ncbi:MAG: hypothetical protein GY719_33730 [bacterium]|nr:hypothetical protein [bacterium]